MIYTGDRDAKRARDSLRAQAGDYAALFDTGEIPISAIDFHGGEWERDFMEVSTWARKAIGRASDCYGHRVPGIYARAADFCEREIARKGGREIIDFQDWEKEISELAPVPRGTERPGIMREQAIAAARFLHQCGVLFWMKDRMNDGYVLIDQRWAADLIYGLLDWREASQFRSGSFKLIEADRFVEMLDGNRRYGNLTSLQKRTFLHFLDACDVCVRVGERWMAAQRELLPVKTEEIECELEVLWNAGRASAPGMVNHCFAIHGAETSLLGNSDYRQALAFLVRGMESDLGKRFFPRQVEDEDSEGRSGWTRDSAWRPHAEWRFWSDGFLMTVGKTDGDKQKESDSRWTESRPTLALQVEWRPMVQPETGKKGFAGGLFIQYLAPENQGYEGRLRDILFGTGGPLSIFEGAGHVESDHRPIDLAGESMGSRRGFGLPAWNHADGPDRPDFRYDVAISYRSAQKETVAELVGALRRERITHCYEYSGDDLNALQQRPGGSMITDIYDYLKYAKILIVVASDEYFETADLDQRKNLYCPIELAEAVQAHSGYNPDERAQFKMTDRSRSPFRFFWLAVNLSANDIVDRVNAVLNSYFPNVSQRRAPEGLRTQNLSLIDEREYRAMESCNENKLKSFLDGVGRDSKQIVRKDKDGLWVTEIVKRIKSQLENQ